MQPEERDLIGGLFGRLKQFEGQPRDPEAERLIAGSIAAQPAAPYLLVQTVLVQEQALKGAQARIAELEAKTAAPSFLGSAPKIGPWGSAPGAAQPAAQPAAPQPFQQAAPAGGGFMRQAMMTAAGVAGGALLFEGIRNMMGHTANPFGASPAAAMDTSQLMPSDLRSNEQPVDEYDTSTNDNSSDDDGGGFDSGAVDDI